MKLSEYGLFDKTGKLIESSSEKFTTVLNLFLPRKRGSKEFDKYELKRFNKS